MTTVRLDPELTAGLEKLADDRDSGRSDAIRFALRDWLIGHGYIPHREDPERAN